MAPVASVVDESEDEVASSAREAFLGLDLPTLVAFAAGGGLLLLLVCYALRRATVRAWGRFAVKPSTNRVKPSKSSPSEPSLPEPVAFATHVARLETLTTTHGAVKLAKARCGGSSGHIELRDEVSLDLGASHQPAPPQPLPPFVKTLSKLLPQQLGTPRPSRAVAARAAAAAPVVARGGLSKQGSSGMLGVLAAGKLQELRHPRRERHGNELTPHSPSGSQLESIADANERCSVGSSVDAPSIRQDGDGGAEQSYGDSEDSSDTAAVRQFI